MEGIKRRSCPALIGSKYWPTVRWGSISSLPSVCVCVLGEGCSVEETRT